MFAWWLEYEDEIVYNIRDNKEVQDKSEDIWFGDIISWVFIIKGLIFDIARVDDGWVLKV